MNYSWSSIASSCLQDAGDNDSIKTTAIGKDSEISARMIELGTTDYKSSLLSVHSLEKNYHATTHQLFIKAALILPGPTLVSFSGQSR